MQTIPRSTGVRVTIPDSWAVEPAEAPPRRTRGLPRAFGPVSMPGATPIAASELVAALPSQDMTLVDQIELQSGPSCAGERRGNSGELEVDLASDEGAVVLLEQDGMFSWNLPAFNGASTPANVR